MCPQNATKAAIPFYGSYQETDLPALFGSAGLRLQGADTAYMTKALLFERAN